jgi:hypothetical protein
MNKAARILVIFSAVISMASCGILMPNASYTITNLGFSYPSFITIYAHVDYEVIASNEEYLIDTYIIAFDVYDTRENIYTSTDMLLNIPLENPDDPSIEPTSEQAVIGWYEQFTIRKVVPRHIEIWPAWNVSFNRYVIPFVPQDDGSWVADTRAPVNVDDGTLPQGENDGSGAVDNPVDVTWNPIAPAKRD